MAKIDGRAWNVEVGIPTSAEDAWSGLAIEVSGETGTTTVSGIEYVRSGRANHLHDTYVWDGATGEWVTAQRPLSLVGDNGCVPLLENATARKQEPSGVCMDPFQTLASKMPLVQAQLDNSNRPAVPAQFGQPFGPDLDKLQKRSETIASDLVICGGRCKI